MFFIVGYTAGTGVATALINVMLHMTQRKNECRILSQSVGKILGLVGISANLMHGSTDSHDNRGAKSLCWVSGCKFFLLELELSRN